MNCSAGERDRPLWRAVLPGLGRAQVRWRGNWWLRGGQWSACVAVMEK